MTVSLDCPQTLVTPPLATSKQSEQFARVKKTLVYSQHQQWITSTMIQQQQAQSDPFMEQAYYFSSTPTLKIVAQIKEALILPRGRARK